MQVIIWLEVRPPKDPLELCVGQRQELLIRVNAFGGDSILRMGAARLSPGTFSATNSHPRFATLQKKENRPENYGIAEPYQGERYDIAGVRPGQGILTFKATVGDAEPASKQVAFKVSRCDYKVSTVQTFTTPSTFLAMTMDDVLIAVDETGQLSGTGAPDWVIRVHDLPCQVRASVSETHPVEMAGQITDEGTLDLDLDHADVSVRMAMRCPRLRGVSRTWTDTWGLSDRHVPFPGDGGAFSTIESRGVFRETMAITVEPVERQAVAFVGSGLLLASARMTTTSVSPAQVAESSPSVAPAVSPAPAGAELTFEVAGGPFDLLDPTIGLADQAGYVATLTTTFEGTVAGEPVSVSTTATLRVGPAGRELTLERAPDGPTSWRAELKGASYVKEGDGPCIAASTTVGGSLAQLSELAAELPPLFGASEAVSETVDDVPARRHTFDEASLLLATPAEASGDAWVAESDGRVLRYRSHVDAGPELLGDGVTGSRSVDYVLSTPERPPAIGLPADCPPMVDAPVLDDATDVVRRPGILAFRSTMAVAKAARSYTRQLRDKGWKPTFPAEVTKSTALLGFRKGKRDIAIVMGRRSGETRVHVAITR